MTTRMRTSDNRTEGVDDTVDLREVLAKLWISKVVHSRLGPHLCRFAFVDREADHANLYQRSSRRDQAAAGAGYR